MSADAATEVQRAIAALKALDFIMGVRDKAFDVQVKQALAHLNNARALISAGPAPLESAGLEASIVEWLFSCADAALAQAGAMPSLEPDAEAAPGRALQTLESALLSIREWAARLLQKPAAAASGPQGVATPWGPR